MYKFLLIPSLGLAGVFGLGACNKLSTTIQRSPIEFSGIDGIDLSTDGAYVINWGFAAGAEVESFSLYYQRIDASLVDTMNVDKTLIDAGVKAPVESLVYPAVTGQLLTILEPTQNSFKTPALDEGYYLFQVKALTKDGRIDENLAVYLLKVNPSIQFRGLAVATIEGSNLLLKWLPAPGIRENESHHYTVYKGPAFNTALTYTKETQFIYPLTNEIDGDTLSFGVRFTNGQNIEDQNSTLISVTVPQFNKGFLGCLSATALSSDRIKLNYEWPTSSNFKEFRVYRNQKEVFSSTDRSVISFTDRGLSEGETYTYSCMAFDSTNSLSGTNTVKIGTLSTNPPTFAGIKTAGAESARVAALTWGVSSGVPAKEFQVFATPGNTVNFGSEASLRVGLSQLSAKVSDLGDDLFYSFGVRSCTATVCDTNSEQVTLRMPDNGAPLTSGAKSVVIEQGKLRIEAPWVPAQGEVTKRLIYLKVDGASSQAIGDYTLVRTVLVTDLLAVPEFLYFDNPVAGKAHHIIVRDEDSHGNRNTNLSIVSVTTGDLTPPVFNGISALDVGSVGQEETTLKVGFTALEPSSVAIGGAENYRFYAREGGGASCNETYFKAQVSGSSYAAGPAIYTLSGLNPKTNYSVCVKVVDKFSNISVNSNFLVRSTLDKTKPDFDGIQNLTYDAIESVVRLGWNPSPSADIYEYEIETWLTPSGQVTPIQTTISRRHTDSPTGFNLTQLIIPFQSGDTLEVVVHACDNAGSIAGGSKNCKTYARANGLSVTFQDILPPPNFLGISAVGSQLTPVQGKIVVNWIAPASWVDYSGFKIYKVDPDNTLTVMKDCPCSAADCPNQITSCELNDLDHFRSYRLHVRAYDQQNNYTLLDPAASYAEVRTSDQTAPVFTSNLDLTFTTGAASLSWSGATDNQYAQEPGAVIHYRLYRKALTNFGNLLDPANDGTLIAEQTTLSYTDVGNFVSGQAYYYTVCAVDASENLNCDGNFKTVVVPDLVPPEIVSFTTNKTDSTKTWSLSWSATDNIDAAGDLLVRIKYRYSADANAILTDADTTLFTQIGATTLPSLVGPLNTDTYIHYLLSITDEAGNVSKKQLTLYSQNRIQILSVKASEGTTLGGKLIYIVGKGFHSSSTVSIGGSSCSSLQIISSEHMLCRSPAKSEGTYTMVITNNDNSSASLANAYTSCVPDSTCTLPCNNPSSWETPFAIHTGRGTSEALPYLICDGAQLWNITGKGTGFFYKLGDNIDLSAYTANSWTGITSSGQGDNFNGFFDGDGHAVSNLTFDSAGHGSPIGLFRRFSGASRISKLAVLNATIVGGNFAGALVGASDENSNMIVEDVVVQATVTGSNWVGGLGGEYRGNLYRAKAFTTVAGVGNIGGVVGMKRNASADVSWSGSVLGNDVNASNIGGVFGDSAANGATSTAIIGKGSVVSQGTVNWHVGGLFGANQNMILRDSEFSGTVTGFKEIGGISGWSTNVTYDNVVVRGTVSGTYRVAGFSGWNRKVTVMNSTNYATITNTGSETSGILAYVEGSVTDFNTIKDSTRNLGDVTGGGNATGGLAGSVRWLSILSSHNEGDIIGGEWVGGLVGYNTGTSHIVVTDSYNTGDVTGNNNFTGGLIGVVNNSKVNVVTSCFSTGKVTGRTFVGGLIGQYQGTITNSYATGDVVGTGDHVGGFIGWVPTPAEAHTSLIEDNYASGDVKGGTVSSGGRTGGFIGNLNSRATVRRNYALGNVSGFDWTGGFIGGLEGNGNLVELNYSSGDVSGTGTYVGGFVGVNCVNSSALADCVTSNNYTRSNVLANNRAGGFAGWARMTISNNYATGRVERIASEAQFGPFVGETNSPVSFSNNFWDKTTSERATGTGTSAVGKTSMEMKDPSTFSSYDNSLWHFSVGSYPKFIWEVTP